MTNLETRPSVLDPADDQVSILELSVGGDAEDDVAQGGHMHFEGHFLVVDRPEHVVVGVELHRMHPLAVDGRC